MKKFSARHLIGWTCISTAIVAFASACGSGVYSAPRQPAQKLGSEEAVRSEIFPSEQDSAWLEDLIVTEDTEDTTDPFLMKILKETGETLDLQGQFALSSDSPAVIGEILPTLPSFQEATPETQQRAAAVLTEASEPPPPEIDKKTLIQKALEIPAGQPNLNVSLNKKGVLRILSPSPTSHPMGLKIKSLEGIRRVVLDRGVYSGWTFTGSDRRDVLVFGGQGTIINKRRGGTVDFGVDNKPDKFVFKNTINVDRCSEKHGFRCHPLNHLQQVVIKNFGPEDIVVLQGKTFTFKDLKGESLPGVPVERLRVIKIGK